jgi:hypothetical protein
MEMKFVLFKTIVYAMIIDVILESHKRIYGILAIDSLFVVIMGLMLMILKVGSAMYITLLMGIFGFTVVICLIMAGAYVIAWALKRRGRAQNVEQG